MRDFITNIILMLQLCYVAVIFSDDYGNFTDLVSTYDGINNITSSEEEGNQTDDDLQLCGVPFESPLLQNRIVGGHEAKRCLWPWQVSLQRRGRHSWYHTCGGSIINQHWILTAAHCVYPERNVSNYRVVVGEFDRFQHDSTEQVYDVRQLIVHEKYVGLPTFWDCDIALLEIDGHCPVTTCSLPICLPSDNDTDPRLCFATGWGRDIEGGKATRTLHEVELTLFNRSTCNQPSWYASILTDNMICAGSIKGGRGTCTGDSGGPLACVDRSLKNWKIYGVCSWAKVPCAGPDSPTVFTRVSAFIEWINNQIGKS